jgi:acyl carrier protein
MEFENHIQHRKLTVRDLRKFLEMRLPHYMIPSIFIIIDSIPLTKSGKINFSALPEPRLGNVKGSMYEPPVSDIENKLIHVWQEILGIQGIGITDNFFEIGGDSFKALQLALALQTEYNIDINDIIKYQTISELVRRITPKVQKTKEFLYTLYEEYTKTLEQEKKKNEQVKNNRSFFIIDYDERYKSLDLKETKNFESILLTGATGYLGVHLADELLKQTSASLYLLIRAKNIDEAEIRLKKMLDFYFGNDYYQKHSHRINILSGDLAKENIGLSDNKYHELSECVDCIINSAAIVKHFGNVTEFLDVNVKGPERLLHFAQKRRKKDV